MEKKIFIVEHSGRVALFAPLYGLIMELRDGEKENALALLAQPGPLFLERLTEMFPEIDRANLFSEEPKRTIAGDEGGLFCPTGAALFPTFDCSLRCVYCYSNAGERRMKANMELDLAQATVDFIVRNTVVQKKTECSLHFHGGGEPTRNWNIFSSALSYWVMSKTFHRKPVDVLIL